MTERPVKLLCIIPGSFCFGLQHVSIALLAEIKSKVELHFLVTRWNNGEFINLLKKHNFNYSLSWLGMFSRKLDWYYLRMSLHALIKLPVLYVDFIGLVRRQKPDLFLFANHHELILLQPVLWLFNKIPVVCHMHDPPPAISFQKKTFRWYGRSVDKFIAISEDVKRRLMELGCRENKIAVVHNGIKIPDLNAIKFSRNSPFLNQFGWPDDSFVVGITGQMTETKGHEDLLEAFIVALRQNLKLRLVIGGKKLEPLFSLLQKRIQEKKLNDFIAFTDWINDVNIFYENIDLFVLASRHDEGYGLVVAEAMAHCKPVVITKSGGAAEIVQDGISGIIVPKRSIELLAKQIVNLSKNPELCRQLGINARKRINDSFDIYRAAELFFDTLKTAISK